jgi:hypothetical protein
MASKIFYVCFYVEEDPRVSKYVSLRNTKTDGYGLYSYHKITQHGVRLKYFQRETVFLKKAAVDARCSNWLDSAF